MVRSRAREDTSEQERACKQLKMQDPSGRRRRGGRRNETRSRAQTIHYLITHSPSTATLHHHIATHSRAQQGANIGSSICVQLSWNAQRYKGLLVLEAASSSCTTILQARSWHAIVVPVQSALPCDVLCDDLCSPAAHDAAALTQERGVGGGGWHEASRGTRAQHTWAGHTGS